MKVFTVTFKEYDKQGKITVPFVLCDSQEDEIRFFQDLENLCIKHSKEAHDKEIVKAKGK